ncbi:MAG: hypothetical protein JSV32_07130 [Dehalococcoidia bacterium]|nr:MAG: hypothetical protein JSV32_07130 [Dehalococcoidia bacterium]
MKLKLYVAITVLVMMTLIDGACTQPSTETTTATPIEVPKEGNRGEYIDVIIQVSSNQPCRIVLSTPHKTEIDNYLSPYTSDVLAIPNSDGNVVFHERIPWETSPGVYQLKVIQMRYDGDMEAVEILSQDFIVS